MNLSRTAISYEIKHGSAMGLVRFYLRAQLLAILIWAASDLILVWYFSGRIAGAHQYFGRWILAWFFTQEVPLYFLSLPYRGGRATIGSMYRYLNWRFFQGRSFGRWFCTYSLPALLPMVAVVLVVAFLLSRDADDNHDGKHIRGLAMIPPRRLSRELRRTALRGDRPGVELGNVRIPRSTEIEHILITGGDRGRQVDGDPLVAAPDTGARRHRGRRRSRVRIRGRVP